MGHGSRAPGPRSPTKGSIDKKRSAETQAPEVQAESNTIRSRYIPAKVRSEILLRSQGKCEWVNSQTKERCDSRNRVQLDHQIPFSVGGENSAGNLRLLCSGHNQAAAIEFFGLPKMIPFLREGQDVGASDGTGQSQFGESVEALTPYSSLI